MRHRRDRTGLAGEGGYALVFALAVMLVVLIIGLRYLAVVHSRQKVTNNEKDALQASLVADAGIERAVRQLSLDMGWDGSYSSLPFAGGTYSASVTGRTASYVAVSAEGTYRGVTRRRTARVYTPDSSGTVRLWGSCYGTGANEWKDKEDLVDSADGEMSTHSYHKLGEGADQMSLTGFGSDIRSAAIVKVEVVISGYVSQNVYDDNLYVQWQLPGLGASGVWHNWPESDLDAHVGSWNAGRMYLDITADAPSGGWQWQHFYHGTDIELRFCSVRVYTDDNVYLYVDCAGFRVTWDTGG
jgi:hypothetical protein